MPLLCFKFPNMRLLGNMLQCSKRECHQFVIQAISHKQKNTAFVKKLSGDSPKINRVCPPSSTLMTKDSFRCYFGTLLSFARFS